MDIHAHVPTVGKSASHWLLEGVFIVASVLLGFGVGQYRDYRDNQELARRALTSLQAELEYNLATVEPYVAFHRAFIENLKGVDAKLPEMQASAFEIYLRLRPPLPSNTNADVPTPRRAAWDAAASTGALRLIDYDLIAGLSAIYQMQDHLAIAINNRMPFGLPAFFEPDSRRPALMQTYAGLSEVAYSEESLVTLYRKELPALRAAAAGR
ncbi:MAG TPA: hypothetical protein VG871_16890 [Vicinamibacterales bacterium]|nr:hypothetical protein [Vicinamibacterales bacterium]